MAQTATLETAAATVRAVCAPYAMEITSNKVDCISELIQTNLTDDQIGRIREIVRNHNAALEPPMSIDEACRLLGGISKQALHYHIRAGHIRRCTVAGAARGRGVVAADVRAIVEGRAA